MRKVLDDVYISLVSGFVNIYAVGSPDGFSIIDAGIESDSTQLVKDLERDGFDINHLQSIVITHGHPDHIGCALELRKKTNAPIYIHEGDREYLPSADVFLKGGEILPIIGGLEVIPSPGHTDGSISLYQRERKIMFLGDQGRMGDDGFLHLSEPTPYNKDTMAALGTIKFLISKYDMDAVFLGHGDPILESVKETLSNAKEPL